MNYAVILAGGVGSRFWPFSRELEPKQFMKVIGEESLLQATVRRIEGLIDCRRIYIVTNSVYFYEAKAQVAAFGIPDANIILEPQGKNTAPAIGLCARLIGAMDKDASLLVLPADHYIKDAGRLRKTLKKAFDCAEKGFLVTIGIRPDAPSTGYGYIKTTKDTGKGFLGVEKFLEKPGLSAAKRYIKDRNYFWNSGMFAWKASVFLDELKKYLPKLYADLNRIASAGDIGRIWPRIQPISVDYGVMEHSKKIALVPAFFYWTDLGSWEALAGISPKDAEGNVCGGDTINVDSRGVCVFSRGNRLVSTIGVSNMVIADTPDALLVCSRDRAQDVKKLVDNLKALKRKERHVHLTERRPWGHFTVLRQGPGFKIKLIELSGGKRLSLQRHRSRAEHWVVVSGTAKVTNAGKVSFVRNNESIYIPKGRKHRLENPLRKPLKIVEVQTGAYLEEDDIERFEDDFIKECRQFKP